MDIFITYVSWGSGGKSRPVLVLGRREAVVFIFCITTQYKAKSPSVRARYFKIADWRQAGLAKQSYVDTNTVLDLPIAALDSKSPIGKLTESDIHKLLEFLNASR
ncbi:MAG: MazF family toxin-antitoxin system [Candidatus Adiutrix sp.]|jgi:mRNA-degrading endonuclease toxin of MazEF toxin-antitoxin module|nr:MazF family toxin-antitoxin system [Candidatus Adiutrix sp.]